MCLLMMDVILPKQSDDYIHVQQPDHFTGNRKYFP